MCFNWSTCFSLGIKKFITSITCTCTFTNSSSFVHSLSTHTCTHTHTHTRTHTHTHRSMILPYKLTPHLIILTGFKKGQTDFSSQILLGTGHKGSQRMKHTTAQSAVQKLHSSNREATMTCVVLYSNEWYKPWSKLCVKEIKIEDIKNQLV